MTGSPKMSLIVLFYNQAKFVDEAVRSALVQDYANCEIILSDDASTDGTGERMRELAEAYDGPHKVIVNVNEKNMGTGAHLAKAIAMCGGDWIVAQGGDDVSLPNRLSVTARYISAHPGAAAIGVGAIAIDENGRRIEDSHCVEHPVVYKKLAADCASVTTSQTPGDDVSFAMIVGAMAAYRRDVIELAPIPGNILVEDVFLCYRAILLGDIVYASERCVLQRINTHSITRQGSKGGSRNSRRATRRRMTASVDRSYQALLDEAGGYPSAPPPGWTKSLSALCAAGRLSRFEHGPVSFGNLGRYCVDWDASGLGCAGMWRRTFKLGTHWQLMRLILFRCVKAIFTFGRTKENG